MGLLGGRRYLALLIALLVLIVVYPMWSGPLAVRLMYDALLTTVYGVGLLTVFRPGGRALALLLSVPTLLGLWTGYVLPGLPRAPAAFVFHAVGAVLLLLTVSVILKDVYHQDRIDADSIRGALCGYMLIGLAFAHLYCLVVALDPVAFQASDEVLAKLRDETQVHFQLTYFSFMTVTTVGYGDIAPASAGARGLAVIEAVIGQFYVVVLLGELIGKRVAQSAESAPPG